MHRLLIVIRHLSFIILAALLISLPACQTRPSTLSPSNNYFVYVGTFNIVGSGPNAKTTGSQGIYLYHFNAQTGQLIPAGLAAPAFDNSYLALAPNHKFLYSSANISDPADIAQPHGGAACSYAINTETGKLTPFNQQTTAGLRCVHVSVDTTGHTLFAANYLGNTVASLPINPDGSLAPPASVITHTGSGPNPDRQAHPFPHSIWPSPDGKYAFACDLGTDKVLSYKLKNSQLTFNAALTLPPGSGPRHLTFSPDHKHAYIVSEMACTLTACSYDASTGTLSAFQTLPTLPETPATSPATRPIPSTAAEVKVHPNGKFLYASTRGADMLTVCSIDSTGNLTPVQHIPSAGKAPRSFAIDPTGRFLLASNQMSNNLTLFSIDSTTGTLTPTGASADLPSPVGIIFLPAP